MIRATVLRALDHLQEKEMSILGFSLYLFSFGLDLLRDRVFHSHSFYL